MDGRHTRVLVGVAFLACIVVGCSNRPDVEVVCGVDAGLSSAMANAAGNSWTAEIVDGQVVVTNVQPELDLSERYVFTGDGECPVLESATFTMRLPTIREDGSKDYDAMEVRTFDLEEGTITVQDWDPDGIVSARVAAREPVQFDTYFWAQVGPG